MELAQSCVKLAYYGDVVDALSHASILRYYGDVVDAIVCGVDVVDDAACSKLAYYSDVVDDAACINLAHYGDVVSGAACSNLAHYDAVVCGAGAVMRQACLLRCRSLWSWRSHASSLPITVM